MLSVTDPVRLETREETPQQYAEIPKQKHPTGPGGPKLDEKKRELNSPGNYVSFYSQVASLYTK